MPRHRLAQDEMDAADRKLIHLLARADQIILVYDDKRAVLGYELRRRMIELMRSEIDLDDLMRKKR